MADSKRYCGIGVQFQRMTPYGAQVTVQHGSAAQDGGMQSGDIISEVHTSRSDIKVEEEGNLEWLFGAEGSQVNVSVLRGYPAYQGKHMEQVAGSKPDVPLDSLRKLEFTIDREVIVLGTTKDGMTPADIPWSDPSMQFMCEPMAENDEPAHGLPDALKTNSPDLRRRA